MEKSYGGHFPPKKAQSEPAAAAASPQVEMDYPPKKLARQLDFTGFRGGGGSVPGQAPVVSLLEHAKQIQPQVMKSSQLIVSMKSTQLIRPQLEPQTQPQLQQHIRLMPMQQTPVLPPHPSIRPLYCECFASGIYCDGCNCANCLNNVENEAARREAVEATLERNPNAFRPKIASSPHGAREKTENQIKASVPPSSLSSIPGPRVGNAAALGPSKFTYRSLLADLIQQHDIKELCSLLVVYAREAANMLADEKDASLKQAKCHREASYPSSGVEVMPDDCATGIQANSIRVDEFRIDSADVSKERPISPETLALMCDEQDTICTAAASPPNDLTSLSYNTSFQLPHGQGMTEIYAELERIVLTQTCDCFKKLITLGEIKGKNKMFFNGARYQDIGRQNNVSINGLAMTDLNNQHEPFSNGVANTVPSPLPPQKVDPAITAANNTF